MQSVAEAAASDRDVAAFYKENGFKPIWTGNSSRDKARRAALLRAISEASMHGLPMDRYRGAELQQNLRSVRSERELGRLEVEMSKAFLTYARDVNTGILTPSRVDGDIVRKVPLRSRTSLLVSLAKSSPQAFM
ncbi:MAG: murein L,D-transpeptidase, partial [Pseudomonadota bacterium]